MAPIPQPPLVFDLQTLADIWMGRITRWNHANITRLNLVNVTLPDQDIVVVYTATDAVQTRLFTSALSASVPAFATQVTPPPHTAHHKLQP